MATPVRAATGVDTLDTPALVVNMDRLETNIARLAAVARDAESVGT